MEEDRIPKKIFTQELEGTKRKGKAQERMEKISRKRSSIDGSEKMEKGGYRQDKMEEHCLTGQNPQRAAAPMEEEEKEKKKEEEEEGGGGGK
jgi:hypothetical protein